MVRQTYKAFLLIKAVLLAQLLNISLYAQNEYNPDLKDVWILDRFEMFEKIGADSMAMDTTLLKNDPFFAIFDELIFTSDTTIRLVNNSYLYDAEGVFVLNKDSIFIPFTGAVYRLVYFVKDEHLFFQQQLKPEDTPHNKNLRLRISYKRKQTDE